MNDKELRKSSMERLLDKLDHFLLEEKDNKKKLEFQNEHQ